MSRELSLAQRAEAPGMTSPRLVFLDKDRTLVVDAPSSTDPWIMRLAPGAAEGTRLLSAAGYQLVVVSNQPGVALGAFDESALIGVAGRLRELLGDAGAALTGFCYCPHHPNGIVVPYGRACSCRKPAPGLIVGAAAALGADAGHCWMVGDILDDVEAGHRAGCRTVLVDNGDERDWTPHPMRRPHHVARDLAAAARAIIAADLSLDELQRRRVHAPAGRDLTG
jgi:D-glycero-D-manno-heptose 1,7-bisphosphate phosphatase